MGDQAVNIAKLIPLTGHDPPVDQEILAAVDRMGELATSEARQANRPSSFVTSPSPKTSSAKTRKSTALTARSFR